MKSNKNIAVGKLPQLITTTQLCKRWHIVPKTLLEKEKQGLIAPIKVCRKKLYRISDVLAVENQGGGRNNEK